MTHIPLTNCQTLFLHPRFFSFHKYGFQNPTQTLHTFPIFSPRLSDPGLNLMVKSLQSESKWRGVCKYAERVFNMKIFNTNKNQSNLASGGFKPQGSTSAFLFKKSFSILVNLSSPISRRLGTPPINLGIKIGNVWRVVWNFLDPHFWTGKYQGGKWKKQFENWLREMGQNWTFLSMGWKWPYSFICFVDVVRIFTYVFWIFPIKLPMD